MNYIGSKYRLSDLIIGKMEEYSGGFKNKTFAELFAGTGIISKKMKPQVKKIITNDFEYYSYVINRNIIGNNKKFEFESIISMLNKLPGRKGFIYKNYCANRNSERNYFSSINGKRIDSVRNKIQNLFDSNEINEDQFYFYLASLLKSADKVANTASVYGAYLKHTKKTASKNLLIEPYLFDQTKTKISVFNEDANRLIKNIEGDILYIDPPYNNRQYGANYHLLNTIAAYKPFIPRGKTGLPEYKKSNYCYKNKAAETLEEFIMNANFTDIFMSYNNEGILPHKLIRQIFEKFGKYDLIEFKNYNRFKADKDTNRKFLAKHTTEYLHYLKKY